MKTSNAMITRDEINKAMKEFVAKGGTIEVLPDKFEKDSISKVSMNDKYCSYEDIESFSYFDIA
ncbi:hypothetical protein WDW89_10930 [Deltaproteobacteria bacterium TL4]